ncbi:MAG TPA: hypothetical protein VM754_00340 [Actinomycetota bacterium]|jgi:hypothetical protein|nr:hypothetical protein [Actinomycetota bacterium]
MDKTNYWFKRRRYGYGWVPVARQGWLVVAGYLVLVVAMALAFLDAPEEVQGRELGLFLVFVAVATFGLIRICLVKGPKPHWRWGPTPEDDPAEDY